MDHTEKFCVGQTAEFDRTFSQADIELFARLSGDVNPIHLDEDYAKATPFKTRIAHGMLASSLFSAMLGQHLPGNGTIYLGQTLTFKQPVLPGVKLTCKAEIIHIREDKPIARLKTVLVDPSGVVCIEGEATVKLPSR